MRDIEEIQKQADTIRRHLHNAKYYELVPLKTPLRREMAAALNALLWVLDEEEAQPPMSVFRALFNFKRRGR